jgi:hypothetical protein
MFQFLGRYDNTQPNEAQHKGFIRDTQHNNAHCA